MSLLRHSRRRGNRRGAALITVLWLTAALAVIGFTVARTVREETERTSNLLDGSRANFLARGAIERLMLFLRNPAYSPPGQPPPPYVPGQQRVYWRFPGGDVMLEILPESGKLSLNTSPPEQLAMALRAVGLPPGRAGVLIGAIVNWRTKLPAGVAPASTFWVRHASFEQTEELLLVPGVTPDLYFGYRDRLPGGDVVVRPGLRDVLSIHGSNAHLDVNSAHPALLLAAATPPELVNQLVAMRNVTTITDRILQSMTPGALPSGLRLRAGIDSAYLVKATARPRLPNGQLSDYRRTVAALLVAEVRPAPQPVLTSVHQWYEVASTDTPWPGEAR